MEPYSIWSFCDWLIARRITGLRFTPGAVYCWISSLYGLNSIPLYAHASFRLLLHLGYGQQCCNEHGCVNIAFRSRFQFLWQIPRNRIAWLHDSSIFNFLRTLHTVFHSGCTLRSSTVCEGSNFPVSSPACCLVAVVFDTSHPDRREVILYCGFDLHFPDD